MTTGIYKIERISTGESYIGQSTEIRLRWSAHRSALRRGKHWNAHMQSIFDVDGIDAFKFELLEECLTSQLTELEQKWVDRFSKLGLLLNFNKNVVDPPLAGKKHTEETKAKMKAAAQANREASIARLNSPEAKAKRVQTRRERDNYSHARTPEHREEARKALEKVRHLALTPEALQKRSATRGKPVEQIDLATGALVRMWPSQAAAESDGGFNQQAISAVCLGARKCHGGFGWRFSTEPQTPLF